MRSVLSFDELNQLGIERRSMEFEQYFGEMDITPKQRDKRISLAEELEDEFLDFFAWYITDDRVEEEEMRRNLRSRIRNSLPDDVRKTDNTDDMVNAIADSIADTTRKRASDPFTLSEDRAKENAEDVSNTFWNDYEYAEAVNNRKRFKVWHTIMDGRERPAHGEADGQMVDVFDPFTVGEDLMMYPKDTSLGASLPNIIGCRCTVEYTG